MPLMRVLLVLVGVGVLLWLVNTKNPMDSKIKGILNIVVVIVVVLLTCPPKSSAAARGDFPIRKSLATGQCLLTLPVLATRFFPAQVTP
jgi:hypothetical protein